MKNLLTIFFLAFASILFAQPVSSTITSDGSVVTIATPVNSKLVPVCNFNWVIVDGNLRMWVTGSNEIIPGGRLKYFTVSGVTDNSLKDEALGAISAQCSGGGAGGTLTDGNKGDVTVSDSGSVWNINAGVIGSNEIANGGVGWVDLAQAVKDSIGQTMTNLGRILYVSTTGNNATAEVGNPNKPWADPEAAVAAMSDGDRMKVMGAFSYRVVDGIYLDSLQNVELDFGGMTLLWDTEARRNTTLSANYTGGSSITVSSVPGGWSVGDKVRLCVDTTDATGISRPVEILSIVGNVVTVNAANIQTRYGTPVTFTASSGAKVIKDYFLLGGRFALSGDGPIGVNNTVMVKNVIMDGEWYLGKPTHENYSWHYRSMVYMNAINGVFENCHFRRYGNECVTGTGISMDKCSWNALDTLDRSGGSAFHYSGCDEAMHNAATRGFTLTNSRIYRTNQIADAVIGHSAGAITYSCNGGEHTISGNLFMGNNYVTKGIMGIVTSAEGNDFDRENIIFSNNRCYNYGRIISLDGSSHDIIIADNIFENCGTLTTNTGNLDTINTIKICNNLALHGTILNISNRHKCDPATGSGTTLDVAYNNYGANPAIINVDGAEGQGNLDINVSSGKELRMRGFGAAFVISATTYLSSADRRNIEISNGDTYISPTFASDFVEVQDALKNRIVRWTNNRLMSYHSSGADTALAEGPSRGDYISGSFNNGGRAWKNNFAFDQIYNIATDRFAVIDHYGDLNDNGSVSAPDGYALRAIGFRLNGSSAGRRYDIWRIGAASVVATTGSRLDTLCGLKWMPTITSTGGGLSNWPLDIHSGIAWFRAGTTVNILGSLALSKTITAGGTTGAQTINNHSGSVNFAAGATSLVVTNSLVSTSSVIVCTVADDDTTMKSVAVVAGSGSFTIHANAAATAETRVNFLITN